VAGPLHAGNGSVATCARTKRASKGPPARRLLGLLIGLLVPLALPASAAAIDEFPLVTGGNPGGITEGPPGDGALWFTQETSGEIGRITTGGVVTLEVQVTAPSALLPADPNYVAPVDQIVAGPGGRLWFTLPRDNAIGAITTSGAPQIFDLDSLGFLPNSRPEGLTVGPDGNLWFTEVNGNQIGVLSPSGTKVTEIPTATGPSDITVGPDGALWFTQAHASSNSIGKTIGGSVSHFGLPTPDSGPAGITQGPGGLWFTQSNAASIGLVTTAGQVTEFPGTLAGPSAIAVGRDGALWFTESEANAIGRITPQGVITNHFPVPTPFSEPSDLTSGPDGALWFTEFSGNKIGRIETAPAFNPPPPPPPVAIAEPKRKKRCKVPKVKRLSVKKAKKKLKKAKCKYRVRGKGFVVSTKPKAGKRTTKRVLVKAKPKKARRGARRAVSTAVRP
jgi:streptogramin lyase